MIFFLDEDQSDGLEDGFENLIGFNIPCRNAILSCLKEKKQLLVSFVCFGDEDKGKLRKMILGFNYLKEAEMFVDVFVKLKKERAKGFSGERK